MATTTSAYHRTDAVIFDPAAFRRWCAEPSEHDPTSTNGQRLQLVGTYDSTDPDDNAAVRIERVLDELHEVPHVWRTTTGVGPVTMWCTTDAGAGPAGDGGAVITVTVDNVEVSTGHREAGDLISGTPADYADEDDALQLPAIDAVTEGLTYVADAVNAAVTHFRTVTGQRGQPS